MSHVSTMNAFDWEPLLAERYPTFAIEEEAFLASLKYCNSTDVSAETIYWALKDLRHIPPNLKRLYKEAVYGFNEKVKRRIKNRVANIRRLVRCVESMSLI